MTEQITSCLLIVIVDTNSVWWCRKQAENDQMSLTHCIGSVMVLGNSHLTLAHRNKLAIIAAHTDHSVFLYPRPPSVRANTTRLPDDGQYDAFRQVEAQVRFQLSQLLAKDKEKMEDLFEMEEHPQPSDSLIAGAMCMALSYAHRMEKDCPIGENLSVRILIVKGSEDCPSQYMNFMNAVFTAQKQNIIIDACILDTESGLLQQACDITGGLYLRIPQPQGLLEYLMWVFLPDPVARSKMALPPRAQVDYRAACFCHRHLIDIGYVCSVCLSNFRIFGNMKFSHSVSPVYCTFSPICSTCQTTFKILGPQKITKKKKKS